MISIRIQHRFPTFSVDIDTKFPAVGVTALFGPSGSGKTSILHMISGLRTPEEGHIQIGNNLLFSSTYQINLPPEARNIGYVFQDIRLFPHLTVFDNLIYGHKETVSLSEVISLLALEKLLQRAPATLSGGEQQRVAIGRSLLSDPDLLLLDEPLSSLDGRTKKELLPYLEKLAKTVQLPIVYVSHNLSDILSLAQYLLVLDQGNIIFAGEPQTVVAEEHFQRFQK